jgi:hypothetical protein
MANGDQRCSQLYEAWQGLLDQIQQIQDDIPGLEAQGIKPDAMFRQMRQLQLEANAIHQAYLRCLQAPPAPPKPVTNISIAGIEETQAIQYWNFPAGQGSGYAADNSIPLVSQKPTVLRVYLDVQNRTPKFSVPTTASGTLKVSGPAGQGTLNPLNGPIAAQSAASIKRGQMNDTLNFRIPWSWCVGTLQCSLTAFDPVNPSDSDSTTFNLDFADVPPLPVHGVMIHYTGVDYFDKPVDAQPDGWDLLVTLDYVLRTYPFSGFQFDGCEVLPWSAKLAVTQNFYDLDSKLGDLQAMSGTNDLYIGLMPPEAGCGGICGLGGGLTALYFAGNGPEAAHEIGHALGRPHTPCDVFAGGADPNYPIYNGFPRGSIGEYGFDAERLAVFDPNTTFDFMSYCGPVWVSPWTYLKLKDSIFANWPPAMPQAFQGISPWSANSAEFYYVSFRITRGEQVAKPEIRSAFNLPRRPPKLIGESSDVTLELLDKEGRIVDVQRALARDEHIGRDAPFTDYRASFPATSDLYSIRLVRAGKVLDDWKLSPRSPAVAITEVTRVSRAEHGDLLRLKWRGEADPQSMPPLSYGVRYSHNGGQNWRALATGLTETEYVLNLDLLPGGDECRVQIVASAGLRTTVAESEKFAVSRKARTCRISNPKSGSEYDSGTPVICVGVGFSPDFGATRPDEVVWMSNRTGIVETGYQVALHGLPVGRHRITMTVPDGLGADVSASVEIRVNPKKSCGCNHDHDRNPEPRVPCPKCGH